jgi:preprotein translocase subunit SecG
VFLSSVSTIAASLSFSMSSFFSWPNADAAMSRTVMLAAIVFMVRMRYLQQRSRATHEPLETQDVSRRSVKEWNVARRK